MTLDIDYQSDAEEIVVVIDNCMVIKATKGIKENEVIYCKNFKSLAEEDRVLYNTLKSLIINLFEIES